MSATHVTAPKTSRHAARGRLRWPGAGLMGLSVLLLAALLAPLISRHDPESVNAALIMKPPSLEHWFGTDSLGRDVFARSVYALRASLAVAVGSVLLSAMFAIPLGAVAGYFGGRVDTVVSRPIDMVLVLPPLLLAISLIAILGPGTLIAGVAIALIYLPILTRVMRGSALEVSSHPYVEGARSRGASHRRNLIGHVIPNAVGPALVQLSILAGFALQIEAALSFLGLGTQPPTPSLGLMLSDARGVLTQAPWAEFFPGLVLAAAVLSFIVLGDSLRERLDPQRLGE